MNTNIQSVLLVRHARSLANDDPTLYLRCPDHAIALSRPEDDPEAVAAGRQVRTLGLDPKNICVWTSPYLRCQQTQHILLNEAFGAEAASVFRVCESFLLREQEFGDWDGFSEEEIAQKDPVRFAKRKLLSDHLGRFYFRYPNGESRADVVQRVVSFISKIHRSRFAHHVVFLHGVTQRALRMAWFNRGVGWFESEPNPVNASVLRISRDDKNRWIESYLPTATNQIQRPPNQPQL